MITLFRLARRHPRSLLLFKIRNKGYEWKSSRKLFPPHEVYDKIAANPPKYKSHRFMKNKLVLQLRKETSMPISECIKALAVSDFNFEEAKIALQTASSAYALKVKNIEARNSVFCAKLSPDGNNVIAMKIKAETDFVTKNELFSEYVNNIMDIQLKGDPDAKNQSQMVLDRLMSVVKENISVDSANVLSKTPGNEKREVVGWYLHQSEHPGVGSKGAVVRIAANEDLENGEGVEEIQHLGKLLCMQITAYRPTFINKTDVAIRDIDQQIHLIEINCPLEIRQNPDQNILKRYIKGHIALFFERKCLMEQTMVNDTVTVKEAISKFCAEHEIPGGALKIVEFISVDCKATCV